MLEVVRYRGKEGIYSWSVVQKGFSTIEEAMQSIHLSQTFQKRFLNLHRVQCPRNKVIPRIRNEYACSHTCSAACNQGGLNIRFRIL